MREYSVVMTTCPGSEEAQMIADALLGEELAACIQTMPIQSHYIWEGAVQNGEEILLLIKGKSENYGAIEKAILRLHPYEVPEIIRLPVEGGHDRYLSWLADPR